MYSEGSAVDFSSGQEMGKCDERQIETRVRRIL
jgi:hypothetical protein